MTRRALLAAVVAASACAREPRTSPERLEQLRHAHDLLHDRLEAAAAKDALVTRVLKGDGQVMVAVKSDLLEDVFEVVASRYLQRVVLDLGGVTAHADGALRKHSFIGTLDVGHWSADFTFDRMRGVLHGRTPTVHAAGGNQIRVAMPVSVEETDGRVTAHFTWKSSGIAKAVCRNFDLTRTVTGRVLPARYSVEGAFVLSAAGDTVTAMPRFPKRSYRLRIDLSPESWDEVRAALATQDSLFKCGIPLDPDGVVRKLHELADAGIDVKLPDSLFRPIRFPAATQSAVTIGDKVVEVSARTIAFRLDGDAFWSTASVHALGEPTR